MKLYSEPILIAKEFSEPRNAVGQHLNPPLLPVNLLKQSFYVIVLYVVTLPNQESEKRVQSLLQSTEKEHPAHLKFKWRVNWRISM